MRGFFDREKLLELATDAITVWENELKKTQQKYIDKQVGRLYRTDRRFFGKKTYLTRDEIITYVTSETADRSIRGSLNGAPRWGYRQPDEYYWLNQAKTLKARAEHPYPLRYLLNEKELAILQPVDV